MQDPRRTLPTTMLRAVGAALVLVVAAIIALANIGMGAAEDGDEQEESSEALQPTEIVADIPEGYGELFPFDWGGGSLYHLKGRLATMGCMANTLWFHDGGEWRGYNQYQVPSTLTQEFRDQYAEFVPPGRLYAACFRICEFSYAEYGSKPCRTLDSMRQSGSFERFPHPIDHSTQCTRDFTSIVAASALSVLPLLPELCVMRAELSQYSTRGNAKNPFVGYHHGDGEHHYYPSNVPIVVIWAPSDFLTRGDQAEQRRSETFLLRVEVHELCHGNQHWHIAQGLRTDVVLAKSGGSSKGRFDRLWVDTEAGNEFVQITGFTVSADDEWALPTDSVYQTIYSSSPRELGAEICMMRIFEQMEHENLYRYLYWSTDDDSFQWRAETIEFNADIYLTPEIRRWLETWVLLPGLAGQSDD